MKVDLKLFPHRPMFVQELSDDELNCRGEPCERMLQEFWTVSKRRRVFFNDECTIYLGSRSGNSVFWSKQNPHYCEEVEHHSPHVVVWVAMNSEHLFGPYFCDGPEIHLYCVAMLENWFIPQLQSLEI